MAEIAEGGGGHDKGGKKRPKKGSTRIDMTPMVDLGFLLLTFFVMTTTFSKPKVMSLAYPAKIDTPSPDKQEPINNGVTFLLSEDKIFYYFGQFYAPGNAEGKPVTQLEETNFGPQGLRKLLADKNAFVIKEKELLDNKLKRKEIADTTYERLLNGFKAHKQALKVLIKTDEKATCDNFIDLVDEVKIAQIGVVAPLDLMKSESELLKAKL
ncbi:MAG: biopolymer transporter ExbD [Crocinitomicaceae bacterium]|jgi:biopolymer transport protein ExbD|nr:biopolymer transporter ExbD [Crocinitomicaceae bacterium]